DAKAADDENIQAAPRIREIAGERHAGDPGQEELHALEAFDVILFELEALLQTGLERIDQSGHGTDQAAPGKNADQERQGGHESSPFRGPAQLPLCLSLGVWPGLSLRSPGWTRRGFEDSAQATHQRLQARTARAGILYL